MFDYVKANLLKNLRPIQEFSTRIVSLPLKVGFVPTRSTLLVPLFVICITCGSVVKGYAQEPTWRAREGIPVGVESERYLRILQLAGRVPLHPWTVRAFTPQALEGIRPVSGGHPWQDRIDFDLRPSRSLDLGWIRPRLELVSNSAYPFGENDGLIWAGRGLTGAASAGGFLRFGPLHVRLAPEGFWSENLPFQMAKNGRSGPESYRDEQAPDLIDRPQRFGDQAYRRLGLGSSAVHLALPGITLGISGAGQHWGPALHYPLLLGNNSGGFPNIFGQTTTPIELWAIRLHGRYMFGWPGQSKFSPLSSGENQNFAAGAVLALLPRGLDGLELGLARFVHTALPVGGKVTSEDLLRVFSGVTQETENLASRNQLASAFFRWVVPGAGLEFYGELVKEDFVRDIRHAIEEPDDLMGKVLGFQKVWALADGHLAVLRGEGVDARLHHSERFGRLRMWDSDGNSGGGKPLPLYMHSGGVSHTHFGQVLGSPTAYGGSGWTLGLDWYNENGRWTVDLSRALQTEFSAIYSGTSGPEVSDVIYALKLEAVRFGDAVEWTTALVPSLNLNRNLVKENDAFNLSLRFSINGLPW